MKAFLFTAVAFAFGGCCLAYSGGPMILTLGCFAFAATCLAMALDEWEDC